MKVLKNVVKCTVSCIFVVVALNSATAGEMNRVYEPTVEPKEEKWSEPLPKPTSPPPYLEEPEETDDTDD